MSKDTGNGSYLIGELRRNSRKEYTFKYLIHRDTFPEWFMKIPDIDDLNKEYETEEVKNKIIHRLTPREGSKNAEDMMMQFGMTVYDEWELLLNQIKLWEQLRVYKYPLSDSHQIFYFYDNIPRGANRYDD